VSSAAVSLPDDWRPVTPGDASAVAALTDEDEVFAGFRSQADHATFLREL
jgi:hypothetical protein